MLKTIETVTQILELVRACTRRASSPEALAKRVTSEKVTPREFERVLTVLEAMPYVAVKRSPAGQLLGLEFKLGTGGACSIQLIRCDSFPVHFYYEDRLVATVEYWDKPELARAEAALRINAEANDLPFLDSVRADYIDAIAPFVHKALGAFA